MINLSENFENWQLHCDSCDINLQDSGSHCECVKLRIQSDPSPEKNSIGW